MSPPFIKICCITSPAEARIAIAAGARAIGLVSHMPSGPGVIGDALVAQIAAEVASEAKQLHAQTVKTFLLTARQSAHAIAEQHRACNTTTLQLVDDVPPQELAVAHLVDGLLLDSGNPSLAVKELGGTGRVHDWRYSQQIVAQSSVPVLLAGGLNAGNAALALATVRPYGLDICSGVRRRQGGVSALDAARLAAFMLACSP